MNTFEALINEADRSKEMALLKSSDPSLKVLLGLTVKSITENEDQGILDLSYTLTVKMLEDKHGSLSININKEGDEIPTYRNRRYNQNGVIEAYSGTAELISCSAHKNSTVRCASDVDFCPFIVSTYDLSIKLNALDEDNEKQKRKSVFVSRYVDDFIQFQAEAIGRGVSKADHLGIHGVSKLKKGAAKGLPKIGTTKVDGLFVDLDVVNYETDELIFRFTTRRKQIANLVGVVLPCILVPLIYGELSRRGTLGPDALLSGVLTLIFAMPSEFGAGTSLWFGFSLVLCIACYVVNQPEFGIAIEILSVAGGILLLLAMYVKQLRFVEEGNQGGQRLANLVKDRPKEWKKLNVGEYFCLV